MHGRASVFVPKNMMCFFGVFWFLFGVFGPLQSDHTGPAAVGNQHHQMTYLTRRVSNNVRLGAHWCDFQRLVALFFASLYYKKRTFLAKIGTFSG